ncbi:MAG: DNA starvation/stationary phase protection protein [Bacteroidales bacterium]
MASKAKRTFIKLGYSRMDTAEIVTLLNRLLSGYSVYQQKLRNFHWNIVGQDFFELHNLFEGMYKRAIKETDEVAERIRLFDQKPVSTFTEYIKFSDIKEESTEPTSFEMANIVLSDIRSLLENIEEAINAAQEINDNGTEYMLKSFIYNMEKEHWMLTAWIKQKV